jgi:chromate transporter
VNASPSDREPAVPSLSLAQLALVFARIGSLSWGGGGATLALMHSELCGRRAVVSDAEFQLLFGLSRLVPGMNLLALTVLLGHRAHGLRGALAALAGLTLPSFSLIVLGCLVFAAGRAGPLLGGVIRGLGPAAAALLIHTGWQLSRGTLRGEAALTRIAWLALAAGSAWLAVLGLHAAWIILGGAAVGVLWARRERARGADAAGGASPR